MNLTIFNGNYPMTRISAPRASHAPASKAACAGGIEGALVQRLLNQFTRISKSALVKADSAREPDKLEQSFLTTQKFARSRAIKGLARVLEKNVPNEPGFGRFKG